MSFESKIWPTQLTFHYLQSPVTDQGTATISEWPLAVTQWDFLPNVIAQRCIQMPRLVPITSKICQL